MQEDIQSLDLQIMETYKQVEVSKVFEKQSQLSLLAEGFDREWAEHVRWFSEKKGVVIDTLPSKREVVKGDVKMGGDREVEELMTGFLGGKSF